MNGMAMVVRNDLEFDVMRIDDQLFYIECAVAERFLGFRAGRVKGRAETRFIARDAHSPTATAGHGFDHHRIADAPCDFECFLFILDDPVAARRNRNSGFSRAGPRRILVPHRVHRARRRADELDLAAFADLREMRVLCQKSVSGMNRIHVADFRRAHDAIDL